MIAKKNRNKFLLLFIGVIVVCIFYSSPNLLNSPSIKSLVKTYCNTPQTVSGDEMENIPGYQLKQVQILIRHGDRAPVNPEALPNVDPVKISCLFEFSNADYMSNLKLFKNVIEKKSFVVTGSKDEKLLDEKNLCQPGQLTPFGIIQHLYLGAHLRTNYEQFSGSIDVLKDLHILATDVPRTKQSAAAITIGMFRDKFLEIQIPALVPINVHDDHVEDTHLLLDEKESPLPCPNMKNRSEEFWTSKAYRSFVHDTQTMYDTLAMSLSVDRHELPEFNRIVDVFYTRTCHQLGIPHGPKNDEMIPESLVKSSLDLSHRFHYLKHASPLAELQALSLFSQVARQALLVLRNEKHQKKLVIYSGHDSMIHPFLQVLDSSFTRWPPYASRIVFEIYLPDNYSSDDPDIINRALFRIIYNGKPVEKISFCNSVNGPYMLCPLAEFYRYVSNGFINFAKYDTEVLSDLLFSNIKDVCSSDQ